MVRQLPKEVELKTECQERVCEQQANSLVKMLTTFERQNVKCYIKDLCSVLKVRLRWMARWKGKRGFEAKVKERDKGKRKRTN